MPTYEIVNPSDMYTMKHDSEVDMALAVLLLGEGKYSLVDEEGESVVPMFFFGGAEEWFKTRFGIDLSEAIGSRASSIADALDSVVIGNYNERKKFERLIEFEPEDQRDAFREKWLDQHRSSMNNIGGYAMMLSKRLREVAMESAGEQAQADPV